MNLQQMTVKWLVAWFVMRQEIKKRDGLSLFKCFIVMLIKRAVKSIRWS